MSVLRFLGFILVLIGGVLLFIDGILILPSLLPGITYIVLGVGLFLVSLLALIKKAPSKS